jgi:hypothetical protein
MSDPKNYPQQAPEDDGSVRITAGDGLHGKFIANLMMEIEFSMSQALDTLLSRYPFLRETGAASLLITGLAQTIGQAMGARIAGEMGFLDPEFDSPEDIPDFVGEAVRANPDHADKDEKALAEYSAVLYEKTFRANLAQGIYHGFESMRRASGDKLSRTDSEKAAAKADAMLAMLRTAAAKGNA